MTGTSPAGAGHEAVPAARGRGHPWPGRLCSHRHLAGRLRRVRPRHRPNAHLELAGGRTVTRMRNSAVGRCGPVISAREAGYNASIAAGASVSIDFKGALTGHHTSPSALTAVTVARTGGAARTAGRHLGAPDRTPDGHAGSQPARRGRPRPAGCCPTPGTARTSSPATKSPT
ncbi:cellulose binding domain-containing protein [Actinoplanes sp. NPDC048967]|uniref:cellulose binding domain-containing protein n=1 Tax=Actinoplanes sp. NPDC048967 TaxID=3155269 RepID=UPI0033CE023C